MSVMFLVQKLYVILHDVRAEVTSECGYLRLCVDALLCYVSAAGL